MSSTRLGSTVCRCRKCRFGLMGLLILTPAILCAFKYAEEGLNADIVLNQIMSAQELTLFYWGQNRLLNIVPFCLSFIKFPILNLFCLLLFSTVSCFSLLYLGSLLANRLTFPCSVFRNATLLYLMSIGLCTALFTRGAWVSIALWHFEYTLSLLFLLVGSWLYYRRTGISSWFFPCAFLAFGLNPALILISLSVIGLKILACRQFYKKDPVFCGWSCLCFLFWRYAGCIYGSYSDYDSILFANFQLGLEKLLVGLFSEYINSGTMAVIVASGLLLRLLSDPRGVRATVLNANASYAVCICIIVMVLYSTFVGCIRWVEMNDFAPRYLIPAVFMGLFASQCVFARLVVRIRRGICLSITFILGMATLFFFWPSGFDLESARIYRNCDQAFSPGEHFYAGDYWQSWACVSRDLNHGFSSQGLSYRSSSNHDNIRRALDKKLGATSLLEVYCLGAEPEACKRDVAQHLPDIELASVEQRGDNTLLLLRRAKEPGTTGKGKSGSKE